MAYHNSEKIIGNLNEDLKVTTKLSYIPGNKKNIVSEINLRLKILLKI